MYRYQSLPNRLLLILLLLICCNGAYAQYATAIPMRRQAEAMPTTRNTHYLPATAQVAAAAMRHATDAPALADGILNGEVADLQASGSADKVTVTWKSTDETSIVQFMVERTVDGTEFTPIGSVIANGAAATERGYALVDASPINGSAYYCLYAMNDNGEKNCMGAVATRLHADPCLRLYSNPGSQAQAVVEVNHLTGETVDWQLIDTQGNLALSAENALARDGSITLRLSDYKDLRGGMYILCIQDFKTTFTQRIVLQD